MNNISNQIFQEDSSPHCDIKDETEDTESDRGDPSLFCEIKEEEDQGSEHNEEDILGQEEDVSQFYFSGKLNTQPRKLRSQFINNASRINFYYLIYGGT